MFNLLSYLYLIFYVFIATYNKYIFENHKKSW